MAKQSNVKVAPSKSPSDAPQPAPSIKSKPATRPHVRDDGEVDWTRTRKILGFSLNQNLQSVTFTVKWDDGTESREPEYILQEERPQLVYNFWKYQGGRDAVTKFNRYHVFAILGRRKRNFGFEYKVQWVGFPETEFTWETRAMLRGTPEWKEMVDVYDYDNPTKEDD